MVLYITGRVSDKTIVESGFRSEFDLNPFRQAFAANYGGVYTDYYIYQDAETSSDSLRIKNGDQWVAVWTGDVITGVSFAAYDALEWIRFYASKSSILADNRDSSTISAKIYTADKLGIDTTYSGTIDIDISCSRTTAKMRFIFTKGQASKIFKTDTYGLWGFPGTSKLIGGFKVDTAYIASVQAVI